MSEVRVLPKAFSKLRLSEVSIFAPSNTYSCFVFLCCEVQSANRVLPEQLGLHKSQTKQVFARHDCEQKASFYSYSKLGSRPPRAIRSCTKVRQSSHSQDMIVSRKRPSILTRNLVHPLKGHFSYLFALNFIHPKSPLFSNIFCIYRR
jgi:hypothetical protein